MGEGRSLGFGPGDFNRLQVHPGCRVLMAHPDSVSRMEGHPSEGKSGGALKEAADGENLNDSLLS